MCYVLAMTSNQNTRADAFINAFEFEAASEAASALGAAGRKLEQALETLARFDATPHSNMSRPLLVWEAGQAAMALAIQREAMGFYASQNIQTFYDIPNEVMLSIGTKRPE